MLLLGLLEGNIADSWLPVGAVGVLVASVVGATWTVGSFMRSQEKKLQDLDASIGKLRADIEHRFERMEDRSNSILTHREFWRWVERFRNENPTLKVPTPYEAE